MAIEGEQQRLEVLAEVALAVNTSLDLDQVLAMLLERACELLRAHNGSIMLLDPYDEALKIAVAHGLSAEVVASTRVPLGEGVAGSVAATGEPRRLASGTREREGRLVAVPSAVCVPLKVGRQVLGVLNVSDRSGDDEFDESDLRLATLFAAHGAVAINNARAYEEQERQAAEFRALHEITLALNETLDVNETLAVVLETSIRILGARQGSVMLLEPLSRELSIAVAHGLSDEVVAHSKVPLGRGVAGKVAQSGLPQRLAGGQRARGSSKDSGTDYKAAMSVPLQVQGRVIGVLNVSDKVSDGDFSEHDLELLLTFGSQAAIAIHNATLYDDVSARADQLTSVNNISLALTTSRERDDVLQTVLDEALRLLACDKGSLMLIQTEGPDDADYDVTSPDLGQAAEPARHLAIVVARGLPDEVIASTRITLGEGISGQVAESGEAAVLGTGEVDARSASSARSASLSLPLVAREQVIGVLNLSEHRGGDFTDEQVQLAGTLAAQAAAAIETAQLYEDLRDQFVHSIRVIANAIDARDPYTRGHSERVALYSRMIAVELALPEDEIETIYYAGLLHDVGKIGVRDAILLKEGRLTDEEFGVMQSHPVKSAEIIYPVKQLRHILPGLRHHHERFSARGYPDGLHGSQIPLMARVIGVADTYDAMTSDRPYRAGLARKVALEELARNRGLQFDPDCVNAFLRLVECGDVGKIDGQETDGAADVAEALQAASQN